MPSGRSRRNPAPIGFDTARGFQNGGGRLPCATGSGTQAQRGGINAIPLEFPVSTAMVAEPNSGSGSWRGIATSSTSTCSQGMGADNVDEALPRSKEWFGRGRWPGATAGISTASGAP